MLVVNDEDMNIGMIIRKLAMAIGHWMNYLHSVSSTLLLIESSIRFPLVEFFERRANAAITLEKPHPSLKRKRVDFYFEIPKTINGHINGCIDGYIEMKYIKGATRTKEEKQRIFNDLVRLALINGEDQFNIFIAVGAREDFIANFISIKNKYKVVQDRQKPNNRPQGVYSKWFSFKQGTAKQFNAQGTLYWKPFLQEYKDLNSDEIGSLNIQTTLIASTYKTGYKTGQNGSNVVCIWKVERVQTI